MEDLEKDLREILGDCYGGPSLSVEGKKFVIFFTFDAPYGMEIEASGSTLRECIDNYKKLLNK